MIQFEKQPARPQEARTDVPFQRYVYADGSVWTEFYRDDEGYLLRFPGLADFAVSADGEHVTAWPTAESDSDTVEHLYINQLVPLALSRQGRPTFHASVVTVPGGAIAFLGETGYGKSTLAASYALDDSRFLTDDALIIEETPEGCTVHPGHASLRLWQDSVDALIESESLESVRVSYSTKARLLAGDALAYSDDPQHLLAAFVLGEGDIDGVCINDLSGVARYMAWLRNSFLLDIQDRDMLAQHFEWTHRISDHIPTFLLDYPRDYAMLPSVRENVAKHLAKLDG